MSKYRKLYQNYFPVLPDANCQDEVILCCPFHEDVNPSFSINEATGLWKCFGSCDEGGDGYSFYQKMHDVGFSEAKQKVDEILKNKDGENIVVPIQPDVVDRWHRLLLGTPEVLNFLMDERGLSKETLTKYKIGWDGGRITMPIIDDHNLIMNIRRYLPSGKGQNKVINFKAGYGKARLHPVAALKQDSIMICEGEMDMYLATQMGINTLTNTGGAGTWLSSWSELFRDKTVYICYDVDTAGRDGTQKVAKALDGIAKRVYIIDLPMTEPKGADITDYFVRYGNTLANFKELMQAARVFVPPKRVAASEEDDCDKPSDEVSLSEARQAQYRGKKVKMKVLVVGKDLAPYTIPRKIKFTCNQMTPENKLCQTCNVSNNGGEAILEMPPNPNLLNLIRCTDVQQVGFLRQWAGIPKCSSFRQEIIAPQNIEELLIAPEINYDANRTGDSYTLQKAYFVADNIGAIRPNQSYLVEGVMTPDPWQQYVTFVLKSAKPLQDGISGFAMTGEIREQLKIFQVEEGQSIRDKFQDIHEAFCHNVTHIFGRNDLLAALDLVFHSVLQFNFQGVPVTKGWLECLIIGDTRTGKSESTEKMMAFYRLGEMVFGENASFAGLVGGMQQTQSRWFITWGKIPLNDRRLVVVDEASGLSVDDYARMSGIRSSGVAEITKIQTEKALARTRLVWISNPRSGRALKTYGYGVEAVSELIGKSEDVARFDFVVSAASEEISPELINQFASTEERPPLRYTAELCRALILWAWSRKPGDVIIGPEATRLILDKAIEMGKQYSTKVPLVEPANQRIKIARIAAAVAARVYSTDESGKQIIVLPEHVLFAVDYLNEAYAKPSLDYAALSRQEKEGEHIAQANEEKIKKFITCYPDIADIFLRQNMIRASDLEEQLDIDRMDVKGHIHLLASARMIERSPHGYKKSPSFIALLRQWKNN